MPSTLVWVFGSTARCWMTTTQFECQNHMIAKLPLSLAQLKIVVPVHLRLD